MSQSETERAAAALRGIRVGLSGKLLALTVVFVTLAEILIYVPWIADFRLNWLNDRLAAAHTAALMFESLPSDRTLPESVTKQILSSIGAHTLALKMGTQRNLLAAADMPTRIDQDVDIRTVMWWGAIMDAFDTLLFSKPDDVIRLVGPAPMGGDFLEIVIDEAPLQKAMVNFSVNVLLVSLLITGITGMLVYFSLHYLMVRPMRRITENMIAFRADPENPTRVIARLRPR